MGAAQSLTAVTPELLVISLLLSYCSSNCKDTHPATRLYLANWKPCGLCPPSPMDIVHAMLGPFNCCLDHPNWFFKICFKEQFQKEVPLGT